ncbi:hypothetical protein SteCoe_24473 [Stentor coeruleus]|uniref:Uncharacterized protein n=1 Tax=Stentor coeruleus TaxID=5963 RepID=A0A1R2BHG5_9CILI|nr:hypothetical protein SteCoe_24473 [Stentor coeruleus]
MSIYSGFGTRQQETAYNALVENTIKILQGKVVSNLKEESINENLFKMQLLKNYEMLIKLEAHKYLLPRFSDSIKDLIKVIVKDQIMSPETPSDFWDLKTFESMRKNSSSTRFIGGITDRSSTPTPTLPIVKSMTKSRNLTPVKNQRSEAGFLFARLKNPSNT